MEIYYREIYDEDYGEHLFPIRFAQKLRWTLISLDGYYPLPSLRRGIGRDALIAYLRCDRMNILYNGRKMQGVRAVKDRFR